VGLLAFITNYIPYVGFWLAVLPPAVLALLVGGPQLLIVVVVLYLVVNFVLTSLVQPHFIGDAVGLSITVAFLALVFWGWLLGPVGVAHLPPREVPGRPGARSSPCAHPGRRRPLGLRPPPLPSH
jgi:predicted PurR-regulated permease PerM